jgi:hypothetical protein
MVFHGIFMSMKGIIWEVSVKEVVFIGFVREFAFFRKTLVLDVINFLLL